MPVLTNSKEVIDLTESEFEDVKDLLALLRHEEEWVGQFMSYFSHYLKSDKITPESMLESLTAGLSDAAPDGHEFYGWLIHNHAAESKARSKSSIVELGGGDFTALMNLKEVRDSQSWIASFIDSELFLLAEQKVRRTPRDVLRGLMNEVEQFDTDVEITERMLDHFPKLFAGQPVAEAATEKEESAAK